MDLSMFGRWEQAGTAPLMMPARPRPVNRRGVAKRLVMMKMLRRSAAAALACAALACARPARAQDAVDTTAVVVRGPTVVACWTPMSDAKMARDGDAAEAYGDFALNWRSSQASLRRAGIAAERRDARVVWLADDGRLRAVPCPGVGYVLAEPARQPKLIRGVMTDVDLATAAAAYFRRPDLAPGGSDAGQH
jgi:hypothetical protein